MLFPEAASSVVYPHALDQPTGIAVLLGDTNSDGDSKGRSCCVASPDIPEEVLRV